MDCSLPGSSIHGIFQARVREWGAIAFSDLWDICPKKQLLGNKVHACLTFDPWVRKILWRRAWQPIPVFLPGESLWTEEPGRLQSTGSKESDMTEQLTPSPSCLTLLEVSKLFFSEWLTILHSARYEISSLYAQ